MGKVFKNVVLTGYDGKPIEIIVNAQGNRQEVTMEIALQIILNNAPLKTQQDAINGMRLQLALDKAKDGKENSGDIVLGEGIHEWLKPIAESLTPEIFRINGSLVYEHIKEGFEKLHEKAQ